MSRDCLANGHPLSSNHNALHSFSVSMYVFCERSEPPSRTIGPRCLHLLTYYNKCDKCTSWLYKRYLVCLIYDQGRIEGGGLGGKCTPPGPQIPLLWSQPHSQSAPQRPSSCSGGWRSYKSYYVARATVARTTRSYLV